MVVCVQHHNPTCMVIDWFRLAEVEAVLTYKEHGVRIIDRLGHTLYRQDYCEEFGRSVVVSVDGMTLAVGADGTEAKIVRVYQFDPLSTLWVQQLEVDLCAEGQGKATIGIAVALASDGEVYACGDFLYHVTNRDHGGFVRVFRYQTGAHSYRRKVVPSETPRNALRISVSAFSVTFALSKMYFCLIERCKQLSLPA
jgi:hypothetical protein